MAFTFGATTAPNLFGTNTGSVATSTFPGFGTPTTTQAGFGTTAPGFGSTPGFGTSAAPFGTPTTGFGTTAGTGFPGLPGALFSAGTTGFGTGGTSFGSSAGNLFGAAQQQQQQQQQQQLVLNNLVNLTKAVTQPQIFGDDRDGIIAKWNQLQAIWGIGKGFISQNASVDFTSNSPFCQFKAICYNCVPSIKNEDGLVSLVFKKSSTEIFQNQKVLVDSLHQLFGSRAALSVHIEGVKPLPDDKTEMIIYILERQVTGQTKRYPASEVHAYLTQQTVRKKLMENPLNVEDIIPKSAISPEQLKLYLDNPPTGTDPLLWQQAKKDNPDAEKFIPMPMIGFKELKQRLKFQEQQNKFHQLRLDMIAHELKDLQHKRGNTSARVEEYKRKHMDLSHRLLQVIVKQECYRKLGVAVQPMEEQLCGQLETIQAELNHPTQFKGRLNELLSQIRMQNHISSIRSDANYHMEPIMKEEIGKMLNQQQFAMQKLIELMKEDSQDLHIIEEGLADISQHKR